MVRPMHPIIRKMHWAVWLARYWVLDKYEAECRTLLHWASVLASVLLVVKLMLEGMAGDGADAAASMQCVEAMTRVLDAACRPTTAWVWWVVQIVLLVVSAWVSYATRPKPTTPEPVAGKEPQTEDGKSLRKTYGTNWTDDSAMVGWVNGDAEPIRKKGGKK